MTLTSPRTTALVPPLSDFAEFDRIELEGAGDGNTLIANPGPGFFILDATGMDSGTLEIRQDGVPANTQLYVRIDGQTDTGEIHRFDGNGILRLEGTADLMERDALVVAGTGFGTRDARSVFALTPSDTGSITVRLETEQSSFVFGESDGLVVIDVSGLGFFFVSDDRFEGLGNVALELRGDEGFFGSDFDETYVLQDIPRSFREFNGRNGTDTLAFGPIDFLSGLRVDLNPFPGSPGQITGTVRGGNGQPANIRADVYNFENVIGTALSDQLIGGGIQRSIGPDGQLRDDQTYGLGGGGPNALEGRGGDDRLIGDDIEAQATPFAAQLAYAALLAGTGSAPTREALLELTTAIVDGPSPLDALTRVTDSFAFKAQYSALPPEIFIQQIYVDVLGREVDDAARDHWLSFSQSPAFEALVLRGLAFGAEFFDARMQAEAAAFVRQSTVAAQSDEVFRLYQATLDRAPDLDGFKDWTTRLAGETTLAEAVAGFTDSTEFRNTYGALDDEGFIDLLYDNVLNRAPDAAGRQGWLDVLAGGGDRADVVLGFSESREFVNATRAPLEAWMRAQGTHDRLEGGAGDDVLSGGILSDAFVFNPGEGSDTVMDLERWDTLVFSGFGYGSDAEARAQMTQQGADVVFADQGTSVILLDTMLGAVTDDMIQV